MKASLVFPGITICGWGAFGKPDAGGDANFVQYGLAYISSYAKQMGHSIDLIDFRKLAGWEAFEEEIQNRSPGVFGISATSIDFPVVREAIRRIKDIDRHSITIVGGVHATVSVEEVKQVVEIDHVITGEGEIVFSELLSRIEKNLPSPRVIRGVAADIHSLPHPDRELFDYEKGELANPWLPHMGVPFVSIVTSRGCPFNCKFCQPAERQVFGNSARLRSIDDVMRELNDLRGKYAFKSLLIHDDLFTFHRKWVREFCRRYTGEGFTARFTCQARADFIAKNEDLVHMMADAGLTCYMIGFESGSQRVLDFIGKGTTVEQNYSAAAICRKYGIKIFANYMFGIPTETAEDIRRTVEFIRTVQPDYRSPTVFTPYYGTELHAYCKERGLLLESSGSFFDRAPNTGRKIKHVDYDLVRYAVEQTKHSLAEDQDVAATHTVTALQRPKNVLAKFEMLRRSEGIANSVGRAIRYLIKFTWNQYYGLRYRF
jgi:anaerobic magnesium-protoporphyrin IX monomethyl ester cyclase